MLLEFDRPQEYNSDTMVETRTNRFRCPKCSKDVSLWRDVELTGWQSVDATLAPARTGHPDREADWDSATPTGNYGCAECGWEGHKSELVELGVADQPLPKVHPGQQALV